MDTYEMYDLLNGAVYHKDYVYTAIQRAARMYNWCWHPDATKCSSAEVFYHEFGDYDAIIYCEPIKGTDLACVIIMHPDALGL